MKIFFNNIVRVSVLVKAFRDPEDLAWIGCEEFNSFSLLMDLFVDGIEYLDHLFFQVFPFLSKLNSYLFDEIHLFLEILFVLLDAFLLSGV